MKDPMFQMPRVRTPLKRFWLGGALSKVGPLGISRVSVPTELIFAFLPGPRLSGTYSCFGSGSLLHSGLAETSVTEIALPFDDFLHELQA